MLAGGCWIEVEVTRVQDYRGQGETSWRLFSGAGIFTHDIVAAGRSEASTAT